MAVGRVDGPSKTLRRRWLLPAIIACILFIGNVAGNLIAAELDWLRTDALWVWVVRGVFGVAFLVTILVAIWEYRLPEETEASLVPSGIAPDQHLDFLTSRVLIGHQIEFQRLCTLHDQMVVNRRGHLVFLLAPRGHGRHALAQAVITYARSQGSAVMTADFRRDVSIDQEGLKGYANPVSQKCPNALKLAGWLAVMVRLASVLESQPASPPITDISLGDDPARGLAALLRHVARRQPLVMVWEYLDHADPLWNTILRSLIPEIRQDLPVFLVVTATVAQPLKELPAERLTPVLELAHALNEQQAADVLWLDRVTVEEVERYLGPADPRLPRRLHDLTEGIPALVESLWRQWQETTPPAVVWRNEQWEVAREDDAWVFGEAWAQAQALLDACLTPQIPFDRSQVEEILTYGALEGLTFTAQVVAHVLELEPDDVMDFLDTYLVTRDTRPGLLVDAGFLTLPTVGDQVRHLNRYRFALPYLWYIWVRYGADIQRMTMQRRLADALEYVYAFATDLVSPLLTALFEATEQESRAAPYRYRAQTTASLEALRWQVAFLETAVEQERSDPTDRYQLFTLRVELSDRLEQEGRWEEGYHHAERALIMARTWNDEQRIARALLSMGGNLRQGAKLSQAEDVFNQTLAIYERVLGPDHPSTAASCNNLAEVYRAQGHYSEAAALHQRVLAIRERVLGPDHPSTATSCNNLAAVYRAQGHYSEAAALHQRALAIRERVLGPDHPSTAASCNNLAEVYHAQGRYSEAAALYQRALAIYERVLGPDHPDTATIMGNYVALLRLMHCDAEDNNIEQDA